MTEPTAAGDAVAALWPMADEPPQIEGDTVRMSFSSRPGAIVEAVRRLDDAGVGIEDVTTRRATLDDVFLSLTGEVAAVTVPDDAAELEELAA